MAGVHHKNSPSQQQWTVLVGNYIGGGTHPTIQSCGECEDKAVNF